MDALGLSTRESLKMLAQYTVSVEPYMNIGYRILEYPLILYNGYNSEVWLRSAMH